MTDRPLSASHARPFRPTAVALERNLRLITGLALFAYATCHFVNHALGIFLLPAMDAGSGLLLAVWKTLPGQALLYGSFAIHGALGLRALWRRRHLRMPAFEAWQLALGLLIPLLLIPHAVNVRLGELLFGLEDSYPRLVSFYWLISPDTAILRQFTLLLIVWVHGCIGFHLWLRYKTWYAYWLPALTATAVLIPVLAILGLANAGSSARDRAATEPGFRTGDARPAPAQADEALDRISSSLLVGYAGLVLGTLALRGGRNWHARRFRSVRITYPGGREVIVPRGFSVLEASRWAGFRHASACGGRGRCSTCRVRVTRGLGEQPPPSPLEAATLKRVNAAPGARLACQLRPIADLTVVPVLSASEAGGSTPSRLAGNAFDGAGHELVVTAMFVDLRDSTRLVEGRLPYDALFIVDRYVQAVTHAVHSHGGEVTSVAGDGVMSMFGLDNDAPAGVRSALAAAIAIWQAVDDLSRDLVHELGEPLRFGIGIHSGHSVVGLIGPQGHRSVQFLGDTGNVAARLEALTKEYRCPAILSQNAAGLAGLVAAGLDADEVSLRGRANPLPILLVRERERLVAAVAASEWGGG